MKRFLIALCALALALPCGARRWIPNIPPPTAPHLLAYLMQEGSGTTLNDTSGNGNNATTNAGWSTSSPPVGSTAYQVFNGTSNIASTNTTLDLSSTKVITVKVWFKYTMGTTQEVAWFGDSGGGTHGGFDVYVDSSNNFTAIFTDSAGGLYLWSGNAPTDGLWHLYTVVIDNNVGHSTWYLDGVSQTFTGSNFSWTTSSVFGNKTLSIGARGDLGAFLNGDMNRFYIDAGDTH